MTAYSVTKSKTATLVASTADTVTITGKFRKLQVVNLDASARISVLLNAGAATTDGDNTIPVPPGGIVTLLDDNDEASTSVMPEDFDAAVSLISAGTPSYCVIGF